MLPLPRKITLIDHDRWLSTGYNRSFAWGLVKNEVRADLGFWRVARYNPNLETEGGCYEFSLERRGPAIVCEEFSLLAFEVSRGVALSKFVAKISEWENRLRP